MADWRRPGGWSAAGLDTAAPGGRPHAGRCQQWQPGGNILTKWTSQGGGAVSTRGGSSDSG